MPIFDDALKKRFTGSTAAVAVTSLDTLLVYDNETGLVFKLPVSVLTTAISTSGVASAIHAATSKPTPVDADELPLLDSVSSFSLKKLTWANLKANLASWINSGVLSGFFTTITVNGPSVVDLNTSGTNAYNLFRINGVNSFVVASDSVLFGLPPTSFGSYVFGVGNTYFVATAGSKRTITSDTGFAVIGESSGTHIKATSVGGYLSSDGSPGYTGTVTTTSLVGKTITFKDGIVTNFA